MSYLDEFPVPAPLLPPGLRALIEPVPVDNPLLPVDVAMFHEDDPNAKHEDVTAFDGAAALIAWDTSNAILAPLFVLDELRKADAHEIGEAWLLALENLGFDTAQINDDYGLALDFDEVIKALKTINNGLRDLLDR